MPERKMFYNAAPHLFDKAQRLRENMTSAERLLWEELKENRLKYRFKPQHPLDIFIADFYCHALKLVIEVDGSVHYKQASYDEGRSEELKHNGIKVIRFTNEEVSQSISAVIEKIKEAIQELELSRR
ncbi:MAG: DUF559 domain-containing protein [Bacteroidia bacterium]